MPDNRTRGAPAARWIASGLCAGAYLTLALGVPTCLVAAEPSAGTLRVSCGLAGELELKASNKKKDETRTFTSTNSVFAVPAGQYQLWYYRCTLKAGDGKEWLAITGLESRDDDVFALAAGQVKEVQAGPPFKAKVVVTTQPNRAVALDLKLADAANDTYRIQQAKVAQPAAPGFVVKDKNGKEVLTGVFAYG